MRRGMILLLAGILWPNCAWAVAAAVFVLSINGVIGPATADYVHRGLARAAAAEAQLVVLEMDTPGGLDTSMRDIIRDILAMPIPVAAYVAPSGARAASAGTYILYASHIAAMAPATNLGAATPIQIGGMPDVTGKSKDDEKADKKKPDRKSNAGGAKPGDKEPLNLSSTLTRKQVYDAAAYIRSLAQMRGRNADWAERAVLEAASLSAAEALKLNVIDLIAADVPDLLKQLNGRKIVAAGTERKLDTSSAAVETLAQDWRTRFLSIITEPSLAYILLLVGLYAIVFELTNPGMVLPGVAGTICVLIALYAFHLLPVNYVGLALIVLGIGFMVAEAFFPSYGSLAIGGAIAFVIGSVILIDTDSFAHGIPWGLIGAFAVASLGFLAVMVGMALKARRLPVVSGREELIGSIGEVVADCAGDGWAHVHGEVWRIRSHVPLKADQRVRVVRMLDLVLEVVPESD